MTETQSTRTPKLSERQVAALRWIAKHGTVPPVEPSTWKSLLSRGLAVMPIGESIRLTPEGEALAS